MTSDQPSLAKKANRAGFRLSAARLATVQALYEIDVAGASPDAVLSSFLEKHWRDVTLRDPDLKPEEADKARLANPDPAYLTKLVLGVDQNRTHITDAVNGILTGDWTTERLDALMRSLLFAAAFELEFEPSVPKRVLISEYTDLSHAFFEDNDARFATGVLSSLALAFRPE